MAGHLSEQLHLLQYPTRPSFRPYGDQGVLAAAEMAIVSKQVVDEKQDKSAFELLKPKVVQEEANLRFHFDLDVTENFDSNAVEHRIRRHVLESQIVDTCGTAVDSTFASVEVAVQPNYAIGVFQGQKLMITPLKKFQQVRPNFAHVDEERKKRTIQTKEQVQAERNAQNRLTRVNDTV